MKKTENRKFLLSCESTVDMPYAYMERRGVSVLFYSYTVDGREYPDDMGRDAAALPRFYEQIRQGKIPSTSQINAYCYADYLETLLRQGDVLHITFGSGMTPSVQNAEEAARRLREKYPDRRLVVVDSVCSSSGYGMLVDQAADMRDGGCGMDEVVRWIEDNRRTLHHQFYSTDLHYYRRSGRMSGAAATLATVLGICPIMRLDYDGRIIAYGKVRGRKNAVRETVRTVEAHARDGKNYDGKCFVCHSDCPEDAAAMKRALEQNFPRLRGKIRTFDIGTIIASHCGPGTVAVFFFGDERPT